MTRDRPALPLPDPVLVYGSVVQSMGQAVAAGAGAAEADAEYAPGAAANKLGHDNVSSSFGS